VSKSCQKVVKSCQKVVKKVVKEFSKSSKKLSKSCQKVFKKSIQAGVNTGVILVDGRAAAAAAAHGVHTPARTRAPAPRAIVQAAVRAGCRRPARPGGRPSMNDVANGGNGHKT
jgi:hypothetical protein